VTVGASGAATRRRGRFHELEVAAVRRLTESAVEVAFAVPPELEDDYRYEPGQYVALRATIDGEELRRSYSICAAPRPGELRIAVKRDLGGRFSTWATERLEPGMRLAVMSPDGAFTSRLTDRTGIHLAGVAAGSGVTPMMALAEHTLAADPDARFSLVYSNRTANETMFVDELADLKDRYPARFAVYHVLTRERRSSDLLSGRLDADRFRAVVGALLRPHDVDEWFLCGPFELVQLCRDILGDLGVDPGLVRFELFTTDRPDRPAGQHGSGVAAPTKDEDVRTIRFRLDGTTSTVTTAAHGRESVLNAALRVRGDVPFACAGGVCGTCRARLVDGQVEMTENYALEPDELAAGYVLTCQAVPTTDAVTVDYDG